MSLINNLDFLIHSLRLSYLRNVDDLYGPRLISLNSSYGANPYIVAASLADLDRWPELAMPVSPHVSEDEGERPSGFPGATRLKHTQTIMGPTRSGALGMRTSARHASTSKRASSTPRQANAPETLVNDMDLENLEPTAGSLEVMSETSSEAPKEAVFVPKFKGAAEMEARRRMRMRARRQLPAAAEDRHPAAMFPLNFELSSSEEEVDSIEDEDPFDDIEDVGSNLDDGDEFDPDFAAARTPVVTSTGASEILSLNSGNSVSQSSVLVDAGLRALSPLSPLSESRTTAPTRSGVRSSDSRFEMLTAPPKHDHSQRRPEGRNKNPPHINDAKVPSTSEIAFSRRPVAPIRNIQSPLTAMLASSGVSENPFSELYGAISGRAEPSSMKVTVFYPHAREPYGKPMELVVRKDATVEEVIGLSLWTYWEEGWLPRLDEGLTGEDDSRRATRLSAVGWIMRIAEGDGEVDDEFPPPDRTGKIAKFNFDAYAVLEATPAQSNQNQILQNKIQRRPSRTMAAKKPPSQAQATPSTLVVPTVSGIGTSAASGSALASVPLSTSVGLSASHGPLIFLRIRVAEAADAVHVSTTISVSSGTYMQEALEIVCRKQKLANPNDYALLLEDMSVLIPLDRTVQSLEGAKDLVLVKRSMLPQLGIDLVKSVGKTTDPNASIFKRISDIPELHHNSPIDVTAAYKKYTVYRKSSMLARTERTLAIDGVYVHIMPSTNRAKAVFDSGKTSSYHISSVVGCQQSAKSSSLFKLMVERDRAIKRYDFEAESPKLASEIVQTLKTTLERSGTVNKARRSRQVV